MTPESLYYAIEKNNFKPISVWDSIPYSTQTLHCKRVIDNNEYADYPSQVVADALANFVGSGFGNYLQQQISL